MATAVPLKMRIEGMDCAACALKIEDAVRRMPGVSDISPHQVVHA
ncbi:MAG: heavy-metal-associated domain-containing protein [Xanthobacteraceae bacterium]|nr:heavy-metal-associated domain-containing protein [Xanthobacteraceae bacterium]